MRGHIHDTRLGVGRFFDRRATVLEPSASSNSYGEQVLAWTVLDGHADIPCAVGNRRTTLMPRENRSPEVEETAILLKGAFASIDDTMRVLVDDTTVYQVLQVARAQSALEFTSLTVRRAT